MRKGALDANWSKHGKVSRSVTGPAAVSDGVGLCARCRHVRVVRSGKGSRFVRCALSESDRRFARYPRLPVIECAGYERPAD